MGDYTAVRAHAYTTGAIIRAAYHTDNELGIYNAHNDAFNESTGHKHTGATGDAPKIDATGFDLTDDYAWTGAHSFAGASSFNSTTLPVKINRLNNAQQTTYLAGTPAKGEIWYNTDTDQFMGYNGAACILG